MTQCALAASVLWCLHTFFAARHTLQSEGGRLAMPQCEKGGYKGGFVLILSSYERCF